MPTSPNFNAVSSPPVSTPDTQSNAVIPAGGGGIFGSGQAAGISTTNQTGPLYSDPTQVAGGAGGQNAAQVANAFVNPQSANIYQNIGGAANLQNTPNYGNSPLAGLTTLGQTAQAGGTAIN